MVYYINEIYHHGVKGQKWGVRRYQNRDGTLTKEGLERRKLNRTIKDIETVNRIVDTLSKSEKKMIGMCDDETEFMSKDKANEIIKTFIVKHGDEPISMLQVYNAGENRADLAIATNPKYRNSGATTKNIKRAKNWFYSDSNKDIYELQWNNYKTNPKSGQIADHFGFEKFDEGENWESRRIVKKKRN